MNAHGERKAEFSIPSIIAIVAALLSFAVGAFWGMILAAVAILFGIIGVILSWSPRVRGGVTSTFSLVAGLIGIIVALVKAVSWMTERGGV